MEENKKFTQSAVLFSMTGHVFIRGDASEEYYKQSLEEIKEDAVYNHAMSNVPDTMRKSLWEMYDASSQDVDPILYKYLCRKFPLLARNVSEISKLTVREAIKWLEKYCLDNGYIDIKPISFEELTAIATEVHAEVENEKSSNKL